MADGYQTQTYPDSQNLFTLGMAAIYPTGSWEIFTFSQNATKWQQKNADKISNYVIEKMNLNEKDAFKIIFFA